MKTLPDKITDDMCHAIYKEMLGNHYRNGCWNNKLERDNAIEQYGRIYETILKFALRSWTKIEGPETFPERGSSVFLLGHESFKDRPYLIFPPYHSGEKWCSMGSDVMVMPIPTPTHFSLPVIPEPPTTLQA